VLGDSLEKRGLLMTKKEPLQRKTTLKWTDTGELSSVDMARILERLSDKELTECNFACEVEND
tara:strand:- start:4 stop:192 length:189 start_codon:yes stop_codon:yes gene_type:complete